MAADKQARKRGVSAPMDYMRSFWRPSGRLFIYNNIRAGY